MKVQMPEWLRKDGLKLPTWAKVQKQADLSGRVSIVINADTDGYVNEWFKLLEAESNGKDAKPSKVVDQYWLEVAYQCAKLDLQAAIVGTQFDPRTAGKSAEFHFSRASQWALVKHPHGRGTQPATQGKEAREHYRRIRGSLPM